MLISQQKVTPRINDLLAGFSKQDPELLRKYVPKENLYWVGSGREALRQILLNIGKGKAGPLKIGVPAYTCHVVLEAVKRAGCEPVFYDSDVIAEVKDIKKIINNVDALILSYNYGFLPEVDKIVVLCRENKVLLIEDCAQALGATYQGRLAGSFGDYTFYSFGLSKNIGFCGGLMGSNKKMKLKNLKKFPSPKLLKVILGVLISGLFFNKNIYPLTRKFLEKELTKKQEALDYGLPGFARRVVLNQFKRYGAILERRRKNAEYCLKELEGKVDFVKPVGGTEPAWLYFAVLSGDKGRLKRKLLAGEVELGEMKTFKCLDRKSRKALEAEEKVLTFALYRDFKENKFIVEKLKNG